MLRLWTQEETDCAASGSVSDVGSNSFKAFSTSLRLSWSKLPYQKRRDLVSNNSSYNTRWKTRGSFKVLARNGSHFTLGSPETPASLARLLSGGNKVTERHLNAMTLALSDELVRIGVEDKLKVSLVAETPP